MFTGLIEDLGEVRDVQRTAEGARLEVLTRLARQLRDGDSVAVNGVCLTAVVACGDRFAAQAMNATLAATALGDLQPGSQVNLELPRRVGQPLGGHVVQGHVDGTGRVIDVEADGFARLVRIAADADVLRYVVPKGSVAVDGISLTAAEVGERSFTVSLIPETLERTTLGSAAAGTRVNLEVDVLAKYVEKLMSR